MSFQSLTPEVLAQLTAALPESVLTADQISEDYAHDEMVSAGFRMPDAVVMARSTEEVSKACKILYENNILCTRITSPSFPAEPEPGSAADVRPSAAVWSLIRLR